VTIAASAERAPPPAMPPRPVRPPRLWRLVQVLRADWLAGCDDAMFDELFLERKFLWRRSFIISDPDGIRRVLQDNYDNYPRYDPIRRLFEFGSATGMLCAEGEPWRRHRRLINPALDHRALVPDLPVLSGLAEEVARHLSRLPPGQDIDIAQAFHFWIVASAGRVFAGDDREIDYMVDRMGNYPKESSLLHFVKWPHWLPFLKRYHGGRAEALVFQPLLDRLINDRRSEGYTGRKDLLWRLTAARDRDGGEGLSEAELRDEMITLGATSRSTLRPLTWVWYLLAQHPRAEAKLHAELDSVLGGRSPTVEDLPKLVYLRKVLDETMRLYPPLPFLVPRVATADDVVCGRRIPRNSIVAIVPWVLHRHRKLWRDPDRFDPERFSPDETAARSRYAYLPMSVGPHVCVGASLAMMQMLVAVSVLAQRFRFRLVSGQPVWPKAWIHLGPSRPIRMTIEPRAAAATG
jgi:cytochrome P450